MPPGRMGCQASASSAARLPGTVDRTWSCLGTSAPLDQRIPVSADAEPQRLLDLSTLAEASSAWVYIRVLVKYHVLPSSLYIYVEKWSNKSCGIRSNPCHRLSRSTSVLGSTYSPHKSSSPQNYFQSSCSEVPQCSFLYVSSTQKISRTESIN